MSAPNTFRPDLVPTWAKVAAWLVPVATLPSVIWRMQAIVGGLATGNDPCVDPATYSWWDRLYLIGVLPGVELGAALLTLGLIRPWGESFPRWLPVLGGRVVPVRFAVSVAIAGVFLVAFAVIGMVGKELSAALWDSMGLDGPIGAKPLAGGCEQPGWEVGRWYAPLVLWPPLLLAVTWHYWRRRTAGNRPDADSADPDPATTTTAG